MRHSLYLACAAVLAIGCQPMANSAPAKTDANLPFAMITVAQFDEPWAIEFEPGGQYALITEKGGALKLLRNGLEAVEVKGVPKVDVGGQGGLGDIIFAPDFAKSQIVYLSWVASGEKGTRGAVVGRAKLSSQQDGTTALSSMEIIWSQYPKTSGRGHFGHRMAFGPDGYLYISSGERQKFDPAQNTRSNLGKIVRIDPNPARGIVPQDNPIYNDRVRQELRMHVVRDYEGARSQIEIWSMGHRNPLGLAFDADGRLWDSEMGPKGGDELNLVKRGANYGWPKVSNGSHYDGRDIPDHSPKDGFEPPKVFWNPAISPSSLMIYSGNLFPKWKGDAFIGALSGEALIRVDLNGETAVKADEWPMNTRIRDVEQGPDGAIWLLEDGSTGRLLKLTPKS
jgi:aldose sugar dehydrogenase